MSADTFQARLRDLWAELDATAGGQGEYRALRLPLASGAAVYAALREGDNARSLVFEGPITQAPRGRTNFPGEGISLAETRSAVEGVYRLATSLEGRAYTGPFEALCADLIDVAASESTAAAALDALARRMAAWMASLRRRSGLGEEEARGLLGELLCLGRIGEAFGWERAVSSWTGPDDGIHDVTCGSAAWEIKTTAGAGSFVWINGLDQLDDAGLSELFLVRVALVSDPAGVSLRQAAVDLRGSIQASRPDMLAEFERKLVAGGLIGNEPAADSTYRPGQVRFFRVSEGFPRLTREVTPPAVSEARYQLQVSALLPHECSAEEALEALGA